MKRSNRGRCNDGEGIDRNSFQVFTIFIDDEIHENLNDGIRMKGRNKAKLSIGKKVFNVHRNSNFRSADSKTKKDFRRVRLKSLTKFKRHRIKEKKTISNRNFRFNYFCK